MARLLFTAVVAEARGKLNGNVFTRNKGGAVIRNKVSPINPNTAHQSLQRTYQGTLAQAWRDILTDAQRLSWSAFGKVNQSTGVFGNKRILSGIAAYVGINRLVLAAGGTRIDDPPIAASVPGLTSVTLTANHTGPVLTIGFAPTPYVAPAGLYVFATPAISPGISNVSAQLRFIGFFSAAATPLSIATAWQARFGTFPSVAGQRIAVNVFAMDNTTGTITPGTVASTIVI